MIYDIGGETLDLENLLYTIKFKETAENVTLVDLLIDQLSEFENPLVCLSGGYDSQFMCLLLKQAGIKFSAISYESMWGVNVVNSPDVGIATNFCIKHNIDHEIIKLDLKDFLDSELYIEYGKKYKTGSPQVACHLYFLDQIDYSNRSIIMGGDFPTIQALPENKNNNYHLKDIKIIVRTKNELRNFIDLIVPYKEYGIQNNVKICKDLLFGSPQIMLKSVENYADMIKNHNVIRGPNPNISNNYIKGLYYNSILQDDVEPVLMSYTGFESLKHHFMSMTGDYDHFNSKYRSPLALLQQQYYKETYGLTLDSKLDLNVLLRVKNNHLPGEIAKNIEDYFKNNDVEIIEHWNIEF